MVVVVVVAVVASVATMLETAPVVEEDGGDAGQDAAVAVQVLLSQPGLTAGQQRTLSTVKCPGVSTCHTAEWKAALRTRDEVTVKVNLSQALHTHGAVAQLGPHRSGSLRQDHLQGGDVSRGHHVTAWNTIISTYRYRLIILHTFDVVLFDGEGEAAAV